MKQSRGAGRVVHDYGHGGAGFTLANGCAGEVAAMAAKLQPVDRA